MVRKLNIKQINTIELAVSISKSVLNIRYVLPLVIYHYPSLSSMYSKVLNFYTQGLLIVCSVYSIVILFDRIRAPPFLFSFILFMHFVDAKVYIP